MNLEILFVANCEHAEGPMWHPKEQCLFWVDILAKRLHRYDPGIKIHQYFQFDKMPGAVVPTHTLHTVLISFEDGIALFNTHTEELKYLLHYHKEQANMRANDGKCDPFGNFWTGTMSKTAAAAAGNLYCFSPDYTYQIKIPETTISNGLAWTADGKKMYFIDSILDNIQAFDYLPESQTILNAQAVVHQPSMRYFDGMTIDTEGMLWVAHFGNACIRRWNPHTGQVMLQIAFPCPQVTSLTFGGKDYKTLYITTSQENMSSEERQKYPLSGAIFYINTAFNGQETNVFGHSKNPKQ